MIASKDMLEPHGGEPLPNSRRVFVSGRIHPGLRVPMREITLAPTRSLNGRSEPNEPVRVYDCSGPWGDPAFKGSVEEGLPALRRDWIRTRADVEEYDGRTAHPQDNGFAEGNSKSESRKPRFPMRRPLRAAKGRPVTQLWSARQGIITPEMEFIAIRENLRPKRP